MILKLQSFRNFVISSKKFSVLEIVEKNLVVVHSLSYKEWKCFKYQGQNKRCLHDTYNLNSKELTIIFHFQNWDTMREGKHIFLLSLCYVNG